MEDNVYSFQPPELTPEQRGYWREQAAYWGVIQENNETALGYATRQRNFALQKLGMLSVEAPDGEA